MAWSDTDELSLLRKKISELESTLLMLKTDISDHFDNLSDRISKSIQKRNKLSGNAHLRNTNAKLRGDLKQVRGYAKELEIAQKLQTEDEKLEKIY